MASIDKVQDRSLPVEVEFISLCPTMDLIAVIVGGCEIAVYRVQWQKVASFVLRNHSKLSPSVTSLAWSPDGSFIAVGRSDGVLNIFKFDEDKESYFELEVFPNASITSLLWTNLEEDESFVNECYKQVIRREREAYLSEELLMKVPSPLSLLWCASSDGSIQALFHGRIPLIDIDVYDRAAVYHLYFSNAGYLFFTSPSKQEPFIGAFSLVCFQPHWSHLLWLSENLLQLNEGIRKYATKYDKILETFQEIGTLVEDQFQKLEDLLRDYDDVASNYQQAFLSLINGEKSPVLIQYFVTNVTLMGAERWKKQLQDKICSVKHDYLTQLSMEIRKIMMRLSRMESFLRAGSTGSISCSFIPRNMDTHSQAHFLFQRLNEWKTRIGIFVYRLECFLEWFVNCTQRLSQENGCLENDQGQLSTLSKKIILESILFLEDSHTLQQWFHATKEIMSFSIDDLSNSYNCLCQQIRKEIHSHFPLQQLCWSTYLFNSSLDKSWFSLGNISYYESVGSMNRQINIACICPSSNTIRLLSAKVRNNDSCLYLQDTVEIPLDNLKTVLQASWYDNDHLLWMGIEESSERNERRDEMLVSIGMSHIYLSQPEETKVTRVLPLGALTGKAQIATSLSRGLVGTLVNSRRIVIMDLTEALET